MARDPRQAPTEQYLVALRSEMEDRFRHETEQIRRMRRVREMTQPVALDDAMRIVSTEVRSPDVADKIARLVATMTLNDPEMTVTPTKDGVKAAQENATLREHWTEEVLRYAGTRRAGPSTFVRAVDALACDGGACTKLLYLPDDWNERWSLRLGIGENAAEVEAESTAPKRATKRERGLSAQEYLDASEEAKKAAGPPFLWTSVDIERVFPVFQGSSIGEVLEVSERPLSSTFRQYRLAFDQDRNIVAEELAEPVRPDHAESGSASSVTFLEHWDDTWCTWAVIGVNAKNQPTSKVVKQFKHGYGRHPYFFSPVLVMGYWSNRRVGWGVAEPERWLVEYYSYLLTVHAQVVARDAMPPVLAEIPDTAAPILGADGKPRGPERYQLGQVYFGQPGERRTPLQFQTDLNAFNAHLGLVRSWIDRLGTPRMESSVGDIAASGFAINQVLTESRVRFNPLAQAMARMLEDVTRFLWRLVRVKVQETVWVYNSGAKGTGWLGAGPEDLKDTVRIRWELRPELPSAALIESRYHVEQVQAGFESLDQAREAQGKNPDEVRRGIAEDRMRKSGWYVQWEDQQTADAAGMGHLLRLRQRADAIEQTGMVPPEGGPPAGMGTQGIPDMAALAISPNGEGANAMPMRGSVSGAGPGAVVPRQGAAAAMVQPLTG